MYYSREGIMERAEIIHRARLALRITKRIDKMTVEHLLGCLIRDGKNLNRYGPDEFIYPCEGCNFYSCCCLVTSIVSKRVEQINKKYGWPKQKGNK